MRERQSSSHTYRPWRKHGESSEAQHVRKTSESPHLQTVDKNVESSGAQHLRKTTEVPHSQTVENNVESSEAKHVKETIGPHSYRSLRALRLNV